jgi:homoaconitase/3-isopropylmalate dehydratase large subunit
MADRTLFDKIWDRHVAELGGGFALLHIDRTLLPDLSGARALEEVEQKATRSRARNSPSRRRTMSCRRSPGAPAIPSGPR